MSTKLLVCIAIVVVLYYYVNQAPPVPKKGQGVGYKNVKIPQKCITKHMNSKKQYIRHDFRTAYLSSLKFVKNKIRRQVN